jgi:hypothetical protein
MLHPAVLAELLDAEVAAAVEQFGRPVTRIGHTITAPLRSGTQLRFDAGRYDAEPMAVDVTDADGTPLPPTAWPGTLFHSIHPVHERPFVCIRGTFEYHTHPSHLADRWDLYRGRLQLADLLAHLYDKAG